jgi:cell division topological specificity factor
MVNFLEKLFGPRKPPSGQVAKERLQLVLVHDRSNLTFEQVEAMKDEILDVISRYVDIDRDNVTINLTQRGRESMLTAEVPIQPAGRRHRPAPAKP